MSGNLAWTFRRTVASTGLPEARASAFLACDLSLIGYEPGPFPPFPVPLPGKAKSELGSFCRAAAVNLAIYVFLHVVASAQPDNL
jgi:hypothetical protein